MRMKMKGREGVSLMNSLRGLKGGGRRAIDQERKKVEEMRPRSIGSNHGEIQKL
jgi:hypothetical protein